MFAKGCSNIEMDKQLLAWNQLHNIVNQPKPFSLGDWNNPSVNP